MDTLPKEIIFHLLSFSSGTVSFAVCKLWRSLRKDTKINLQYLNSMSIVNWVRERGCSKDKVITAIVRNGKLNVLKELPFQEYPMYNDLCDFAVKGGHFETLKWLVSKGLVSDVETITLAAENGNLEMLKWLCGTNNFNPDTLVSSTAAEEGHFETLKWLWFNNYPISKHICFFAAESGNLEMLKWLYFKKVPLEGIVYISALVKGNVDILNWLKTLNIDFEKASWFSSVKSKYLHISNVPKGWTSKQIIYYNITLRFYKEIELSILEMSNEEYRDATVVYTQNTS